MTAGRTVRRRARVAWLAAVACWLPCAAGAAAQGSAQEQKPPPPGEELVEFNPLKAEKNLEVGRYYLRSGNYDAAIDRLKDALKYKSNFAAPHRYLGEAYEKKGRLEDAIRHYKRYLEILPSAEDAKKIQKRIAQLQDKLRKDND